MWQAHAWWNGCEDDALEAAPGSAPSVASSAAKERGNAHFRRGELEQAQQKYEDAVRHDNSNVQAWANLALSCLSRGRHEDALSAASVACQLQPSAGKAQALRGLALAELGQPHAALQTLVQARASRYNRQVRKHAALVHKKLEIQVAIGSSGLGGMDAGGQSTHAPHSLPPLRPSTTHPPVGSPGLSPRGRPLTSRAVTPRAAANPFSPRASPRRPPASDVSSWLCGGGASRSQVQALDVEALALSTPARMRSRALLRPEIGSSPRETYARLRELKEEVLWGNFQRDMARRGTPRGRAEVLEEERQAQRPKPVEHIQPERLRRKRHAALPEKMLKYLRYNIRRSPLTIKQVITVPHLLRPSGPRGTRCTSYAYYTCASCA